METIEKKFKQELQNFHKQKMNIGRLWNVPKSTAKLLYSFVLIKSPKNIIEIGTSNGYSTFWLSIAAEICNAKIDTIEVEKDRFKMAKDNLKKRNNITLHLGKAENIIPNLNKTFDLVFIDAGKIGYINYIKLLETKLSHNALIIADNVISHRSTTKDYLDYINSRDYYENVELEIDSGLELSFYKYREE